MSTLTLDFHPSVRSAALQSAMIRALHANRLDPKSLYVTPRQAELWRQVFFRHSPIHGNPEFAQIYRDAFAAALELFTPANSLLAGLGCGTGAKELALYSGLKERSRDAVFAAIDVSAELVLESTEKLTETGASHRRSLVCDLAETDFLETWLGELAPDLPRLITFFGLVPNLPPSNVIRIFRAVLRPGDGLLVSAHLAPAEDESTAAMAKAMATVLPQYDNPETLAWLTAALENTGLTATVTAPIMRIGEIENIPAYIASSRWKSSTRFQQWGESFTPNAEESLRLFSSARYTPGLFETTMHAAGFAIELLAITSCRQEAIWFLRHN